MTSRKQDPGPSLSSQIDHEVIMSPGPDNPFFGSLSTLEAYSSSSQTRPFESSNRSKNDTMSDDHGSCRPDISPTVPSFLFHLQEQSQNRPPLSHGISDYQSSLTFPSRPSTALSHSQDQLLEANHEPQAAIKTSHHPTSVIEAFRQSWHNAGKSVDLTDSMSIDENTARPEVSTALRQSLQITSQPRPTSYTAESSNDKIGQRYFHSRRARKGELDIKWVNPKDPLEKWVTIFPFLAILVGLCISGFLVWDGLQGVINYKYCLVYEDDFANGLDSKVWTKEAEVGGFGNGQFEQTTTTDENVFVQGGMLYIKPTLQDPKLIETNTVIDLSKDGTCSSDLWYNCISSTNTTNGTIIQPVKSGRISTRKSTTAKVKYGRVEVTAKLPQGDWLWPAIWMLPVTPQYGAWPASGEIDIVESRGNNHTYAQGGDNIVSSALHWGPNPANDGWWRTNNKRSALHTTYASTFHTFGIEWSETYLFTYIDSRLLQVLYVNFNPKEPLWQRGRFPLSDSNGSALVDPWSQTGNPSTPFDQEFYLIINVAVGGTNGWFADGKSGKPWVDRVPDAKKMFWEKRDEWYPTWQEGKGEMVIKTVRMWQQQGYNGC